MTPKEQRELEQQQEKEFQERMAKDFNTPSGLEWAKNRSKKACPRCGKPYDQLEWTYYCTPQDSWHCLAGRAGFSSFCPDCEEYVDYINTVMN